MALKSIKNKISNIAQGEVLGSANIKSKSQKNKSTPLIKRSSNKISNQGKTINDNNSKSLKKEKKTFNLFKKESECDDEETLTEKINMNISISENKEDDKISEIEAKKAVEGYKDVLSILGIKEKINVDTEFTSDQLDYIEFTQTQPLGFDFDEVTDFISRTKYSMHKLESALKQREKDIIKIASEVKRVEQKMIEQNQQKELERMIGGMTEEERLIEENMELKVQINDLKRKLENYSSDKISELTKQIEVLQAENEMLKLNNVNDVANKLPSFETIEEKDPFEDMLDDIGGLYDE